MSRCDIANTPRLCADTELVCLHCVMSHPSRSICAGGLYSAHTPNICTYLLVSGLTQQVLIVMGVTK